MLLFFSSLPLFESPVSHMFSYCERPSLQEISSPFPPLKYPQDSSLRPTSLSCDLPRPLTPTREALYPIVPKGNSVIKHRGDERVGLVKFFLRSLWSPPLPFSFFSHMIFRPLTNQWICFTNYLTENTCFFSDVRRECSPR